MNSFSPADKKKLHGMVQEISNALFRMDSERGFIKDVCDRAKNELEIEPKRVRQMAKIHYKNTLQEMKMDSEVLFDLYEDIMAVNKED